MRRGFTIAEYLVILAILGILISFPAFYFIQATMEAKQFNKFSETKITWWDAMWADYRILPDGRK